MIEKFDQPQDQASDRPRVTAEQLKQILEAHRKWGESVGKEGERANLQEANLDGANLRSANLRNADLRGAQGLTAFKVRAAKNWDLAFYSKDFLKKLGLPPDHNERLEKKLAELEKEKKETGAKP